MSINFSVTIHFRYVVILIPRLISRQTCVAIEFDELSNKANPSEPGNKTAQIT
jgi:hypothetical protein